MRVVVRLTLSLALVVIVASPSFARSRRVPPKPEVAAPAAPPTAPSILPNPPTPVRQAQDIGLGQCAATLNLMAGKTLNSAYDVQSGWSRTNPSQHVFQAVAVLNRPANVPPDGMAALIAAPVTSGGCDGVSVQVFPLAGDCQTAQKVIMQGGKTIGAMLNARIMQDAGGNRLFLLPGFANTCIAVAVDSRFGPP